MTFFHVRISISGKRSDETKIDLTEDQLDQQFLQPYREGRVIMINGRSVDPSEISRIRVSRSEQSAKDFIPQIKHEEQNSSVVVVGGPSYSWKAAGRAEDVTDDYIGGPPGYESNSTDSSSVPEAQLRRVTVPSGPGDARSVFIVHGRNLKIHRAVTEFLRSLDLRIIEWEQAVQLTNEPNPYIGDIISAGLANADAVVVLATPDDITRLDPRFAEGPNDPEIESAKQPRQNVIYEAGMAMALAPTRTLIVAFRGTKIPSDISGHHLAFLDNSPEARKRIILRLQNTGINVDETGLGWLTAGDFDDASTSGGSN